MNHAMDIEEILTYLPQRYPLLMIDKVTSIEPGKSITAIKNVTMNEPYFLGHFPGKPIMPGVLILEAMAQTAGILALYANKRRRKKDSLYLFAGIDEARFRQTVVPGDQLYITASALRSKNDIWKCEVIAKVSDKIVCQAKLMGAGKRD